MYTLKHTPRELNKCKNVRQQRDDNPFSSCYCRCWWLRWSSRQSYPRPPRAGHPSPPGSRRSALSAASCAPWCSASSSSSSAGPWLWPCSSSAWLRTPASAADSSCAEPACCGTTWSRSPCGTADASVHSGARDSPGPCGGAAPDTPGTDTGWARTCTSCCGRTASRGERFLCNHGSRFYTVRRQAKTRVYNFLVEQKFLIKTSRRRPTLIFMHPMDLLSLNMMKIRLGLTYFLQQGQVSCLQWRNNSPLGLLQTPWRSLSFKHLTLLRLCCWRCSVPLEPLQYAFFAEDVVAGSPHRAPEDPLANWADQIIVWSLDKLLHIIAAGLCRELKVGLDGGKGNAPTYHFLLPL